MKQSLQRRDDMDEALAGALRMMDFPGTAEPLAVLCRQQPVIGVQKGILLGRHVKLD